MIEGLTPPQVRVMQLLYAESYIFAAKGSTLPVSSTYDGETHRSAHRTLETHCFWGGRTSKWAPSKHHATYNDCAWTFKTISFKVAGELQNKGLASLRMIIQNNWIVLSLTEHGKLVACRLEKQHD